MPVPSRPHLVIDNSDGGRRHTTRVPYWIGAGAVALLLVAGCGNADAATTTPRPATTAPATTLAARVSPTTAPVTTSPAPVVPPAAPKVPVPPAPRPQTVRQPIPPAPPAVKPAPKPAPAPAPAPKPAPKPASSSGCDPNYSGCVPVSSDVDCAGGSGNGPAYVRGPVRVTGNDIYGLDADKDGIGCE